MGTVNTDEGNLRILYSDASESVKNRIFGAASEQLDISTDPRQQLTLPKSQKAQEEDDKIIIEYKALAATSVDYTATETFTKMRIPVTIQNKRTGNVVEDILRHPDFASADVTISSANTWTQIGVYTVGAQERVKLGWANPAMSRLYILLAETGSS